VDFVCVCVCVCALGSWLLVKSVEIVVPRCDFQGPISVVPYGST
jgi:hypothetical protein